MGSTQQTDDPDGTPRVREAVTQARETVLDPVLDAFDPVLRPIIDSLLLKIATMGVFLVVLGAVLNEGVWAAILAVWGFGLVLFGMVFYGLIWWKRR
ncbi:hypothetical protein ACLI4Z_11085 [Natrialbaceae archaeon A-arb3/5]